MLFVLLDGILKASWGLIVEVFALDYLQQNVKLSFKAALIKFLLVALRAAEQDVNLYTDILAP